MRIPAFIDMDLFIINRFSGNTPDSFVDDLLLLDIWFAELKTLVKKKTAKCLHIETQVPFQSPLPFWPFHSLLIPHLPFHLNHLLECLLISDTNGCVCV